MVAIFIDGEAGTTGLGIRRRLAELRLDLLSIALERRRDPAARQGLMAQSHVTILCLPDDAAREAVALAEALGPDAPRLLDASTANRTAETWVYGFAEMDEGQAARIAAARRVSNPGCYATGAIALLRPLTASGLLPADVPLTINAVSGYSGGGRHMIEAHEREQGPAFELYALGLDHKHIPEIMRHGGLAARPLFVPSVGNFAQGMLVNIPLQLQALPGRPSAADLRVAMSRHYAGCRHVAVSAEAPARLRPEALNGTDLMALHVAENAAGTQAVLIALLDNLGKGASGAAVQNLRLMLGWPEAAPDV